MPKKIISAVFQKIETYQSLDSIIEVLLECKQNAEAKGWTDLVFDITNENECKIEGKRLETDTEFQKRVDFEAHCKQTKDEKELNEYKRLRDKFENAKS